MLQQYRCIYHFHCIWCHDVFVLYKHVKLEAELAEMNWTIEWEDMNVIVIAIVSVIAIPVKYLFCTYMVSWKKS